MFQGWTDYYLLIGSASGALIGLLVVVASLTSGLERTTALRGSSVYATPTVFHFAMVLAVSADACAPGLSAAVIGATLGAIALPGLCYALLVGRGIRRLDIGAPPHWTDIWCYAAAPACCYLLLLAGAIGAGLGCSLFPYVVALAAFALLLTAVRNAWDLVTWLAPGGGAHDP